MKLELIDIFCVCVQELPANEPSAAPGNVLSAPDLQLDWVSDSSSDDGVMVVGDDSNAVSTTTYFREFFLFCPF